jgi:hypothetical protein
MMMMMIVNNDIAALISRAHKKTCLGFSCHHISMKSRSVSMHLFYVLIAVLSVAQAVDQYPKRAVWNLFKRVHNKQYADAKEEQYR